MVRTEDKTSIGKKGRRDGRRARGVDPDLQRALAWPMSSGIFRQLTYIPSQSAANRAALAETSECLHRYLETPFSGHRARHEALDYFAGYAAVTGPTVVIPDQRTAVTIRPRHHGLVGHVCPHAIKPDFVVTSRLVLCLPVTRFDVRRV